MSTGNDEQIEYWNGKAGQTWVRSMDRIDGMMVPVTEALLERAAPKAGERAIDVGCGCGSTALELLRRGALVFGIDVSEPMLALAKERAKAEGFQGFAFKRADAATQPLTPDHELVLSRFGVMFFAQPVEAFRNIRTGMTPGGRLCFVCWQSMAENAWMSTAGQAVVPFLTKPATAPDPRAPGPFAFADRDYLRGILEAAGFASIEIEDFRPKLHVGDDLDQAMAFQKDIGPVARALAELEGETREQALAAARAALARHLGPKGIDLGAACWLVSARNAGS
ncbi:class I SAM-dependent methyltransferase [Myxococcota bacterium]|nr:class I SAM-dependent methyltransferase [Myxococcota bacterium]